MNQVMLVGRLTDDPKISDTTKEYARTTIDLAVKRTYKNQNGIYETDFIRCILWNGIAKQVKLYCKKGDTVSVRGRLQVRNYETEQEEKKYITEVIVETIQFICNSKVEE